MSGKPNAMIAKIEENTRAKVTKEVTAKLQGEYEIKMSIALQMSLDAAFFAASEVFRMGPGRVQAFYDAYIKNYREMNRILSDDGKDDVDLVYSTAVIDRRLKDIVGEELFQPWEVRYGA